MSNPYRHPISTPVPELQDIATIAAPTNTAGDAKPDDAVERALKVAVFALGHINATCSGGPRKEPGDKARIALGEVLRLLGPNAYDALTNSPEPTGDAT